MYILIQNLLYIKNYHLNLNIGIIYSLIKEILLKVWKATNKMVFFITHSVEEALFLASRLIVMSPSPGRISHVYDDMPFCHEFLRTGDARAVKSRPDFIKLREEVLSLIHHREPAHV